MLKQGTLRIKFYERTPNSNGGTSYNVHMDQYGRIMKTVVDQKTGKVDYQPSGQSGVANH